MSPGQRDKYRTRTPEASDAKRRREEKLSHHVNIHNCYSIFSVLSSLLPNAFDVFGSEGK